MFGKRLDELEEACLLREITDRLSPQGRVIETGKGPLTSFASNDYLGLCNHPLLKEAAARAVEEYGTGAGASRLLSGGTALHRELEILLSRLKGTEASLLFNSGYAANTGVIPAISGEDTFIFSDELNHASLIEGCRLSRSPVFVYRHNDTDHLESLLSDHRGRRPLIVTDSVFSMDGDIAPLDRLRDLALDYGGILYVDDAHGTGVLGGGRGALSHFGLPPEPFIIQMGTLSKALGSCGAFVAASGEVVRWLVNRARTLIFSTALPPPVVAASLAAVRIILHDDTLVRMLWEKRALLLRGLSSAGIATGRSATPIIPIELRDNPAALRLSGFLRDRGLYVPAVRRPAVRTPRVRITLSAVHTHEDIGLLVKTLEEARNCGLF